MNEKRALLIGDTVKAAYHPMDKIQNLLSDMLKDDITVESTEEYNTLTYEKLKNYDICISYTDCWEGYVSKELAAALTTYVCNGNGLLVLHNGISLQSSFELAQLMGGKFTGHPPMTMLEFQCASPEHQIMSGFIDFEMYEEPYRFDFDNFAEKTVILTYKYEGEQYPAGWTVEYGIGRLAYLMPGHNMNSFSNEAYKKLIANSVKWLLE